MNEDFVTNEIANKLKEKGFKKQCLAYYTQDKEFYYNTCYGSDIERAFKSFNSRPNLICGKRADAPTISQGLKWLREAKRIDAGAVWDNRDGKWIGYINEMDMPDLVGEYVLPNTYYSYEKAALAGIEYVLDKLI